MIKYRHELLKHITKTLCLCIDCHFYIFANSCKIHFSNRSLATFESKKMNLKYQDSLSSND